MTRLESTLSSFASSNTRILASNGSPPSRFRCQALPLEDPDNAFGKVARLNHHSRPSGFAQRRPQVLPSADTEARYLALLGQLEELIPGPFAGVRSKEQKIGLSLFDRLLSGKVTGGHLACPLAETKHGMESR